MKRYLLFAFREYYPSGGMNDLYGHYDSINEVVTTIETIINEYDGRYNVNVLDTKVMQYTDTYDMLDYNKETNKYILDKDELNSLANELFNFDKLNK
jgi:hypothetical protein